MIKDLIDQRFTSHYWSNIPIEKQKIDYILDCAYGAPSKQSIYPYTINVLADSPQAIEFKEWLYWHDTWCVDGARAPIDKTDSTNKTFNGQYLAPLLLMWSMRIPPAEEHNDAPYWKHFNEWWSSKNKEQILADMTVSATFALLAAEEQGLQTGYAVCHSGIFTDTILGQGEIRVGMALGIGYAEADLQTKDIMMHEVVKNGAKQGRQPRNLPNTFPVQNHFFRKRKPSKDILIKFI
tara:strand:+ start:562 stop:1272 length:711 start_codon:yes stop_codon:yes gene_type:complete